MNKYLISILFSILNLIIAFGQTEVIIPEFNDEYSKTIAQLESGETDIDYKKFRESFLNSKQYKVALSKFSELMNLKKEMFEQMSSEEFEKIIVTTKKMLSIDYTNLTAHKVLRQTYGITGDTINAKKYKSIQFGLFKSILSTGNGGSCESAWEVI